jgi:hypothetical protein
LSRPSTAWQPQGHLAWLILDVTIARFRARHEQALAGFLVESLKLCAPAGMVQVGTVALDGTKLAGNASDMAMFCGHANPAIVAAIKAQAERSTQFLPPTEASVEVAEEVARRYPVPMWSSTSTASGSRPWSGAVQGRDPAGSGSRSSTTWTRLPRHWSRATWRWCSPSPP